MAEQSVKILNHGDNAPAFELRGIDETTYTLDDVVGETATLIVFTCNHCPYAKAKFSLLNELAAEYDDVNVVGINPNANDDYPDDSFERMQELVEDGTIAFDYYLFDDSQETAADYGAVCTPDPFFFVTENGSPTLAYHGRLDDAMNPDDTPDKVIIREIIESARSGESIDVHEQPSRGCSIKWREGNEPAYWSEI